MDSKEPIIIEDFYKGRKKRIYKKVAPTLRGDRHGLMVSDVSGLMTSTSTPTKSTPPDLGKPTITQVTLGESMHQKYPTTISFVQDFHAKRLALQARGLVSKRLVERYSSRYAELRKLNDLACYSWKTLKASSATKKAEPSQPSLSPWRSWGTGGSTRFLTASILGFPRIGNECSLSDILEKEVPNRYFLSLKMVKKLMEVKT